MTTLKFYAVRQYSSGKVLGSRLMTEDEAVREVSSWREHIGLAAVVPDSPQTRTAVRANDSAALWLLLLAHEPKVWVRVNESHKARLRLQEAVPGRPTGSGARHGPDRRRVPARVLLPGARAAGRVPDRADRADRDEGRAAWPAGQVHD